MSARYSVGIDVASRTHRVAVLGPGGEAVGKSFTIEATAAGFADLLRALRARGAEPGQTVIGLEATGHLWENLEGYLTRAGYRVVVNPLQTRRYRDVLRKKAKTDDVDAYVIAGLLRSGEAEASYVPDEPMQSPRDLARQSTYSGKAAAARGNVVRTLVTQIERLTAALEELDAAIVAELPPPAADAGPSDAALLQTLPGIGPQTAATWLGELGTVSRFVSAKALVAYVGFYPRLAESGQRQEL